MISDEFGYRSFDENFMKRNFGGCYTKENFNITGFMNGKFVSSNLSMLGRLKNALAAAIMENALLPKMIIVVPDDDIIKIVSSDVKCGLSRCLGRLIDNVMTSFDRSIESIKEHLESKCMREDYPYFMWIQAPLHDGFANNDERVKFNKQMERMAKFHHNTVALQLKKVWKRNDSTLYVSEARRFTTCGYAVYWEAIDKTVKFCDTILIKKILARQKQAALNLELSK